MIKVILYTKLHCLPCEQVNQMLMELAFDIPLEIDIIDITHSHNQNLKGLYEQLIPVIGSPHWDEELVWPFTYDDLEEYLEEIQEILE